MKKLNSPNNENCITTLTSCSEWNGGTIDYLGICNGDSLNNLVWEIVTKLQEIAGEDLSQFDIDSLIDICNQQAPSEITILSILNLIKANQVCLKDFIDTLSEQIAALTNTTSVNVNLKCYAQFDNIGNALSITRDQLDQLVIDNLCSHEDRLDTVEGKVINLQSQIDNINSTSTVEELNFATCVDPAVKPTSSQVISIATAHCDLETATGDPTDISSALSQTPATDNARYGLLAGWIAVPASWADNYNNLLIKLANLEGRVIFMEDNCCAATCDDVKVGFSAVYNEDGDGVVISFTAGAGTSIPSGFTDQGSTITITDIDGNIVEYTTVTPNLIANNAQIEIDVNLLNLEGDLIISITPVIGNGSLTCQKCITKTLKSNTRCDFCTISNTGTDGDIVIVYDDQYRLIVQSTQSTTTTSSTTTTTTIGA